MQPHGISTCTLYTACKQTYIDRLIQRTIGFTGHVFCLEGPSVTTVFLTKLPRYHVTAGTWPQFCPPLNDIHRTRPPPDTYFRLIFQLLYVHYRAGRLTHLQPLLTKYCLSPTHNVPLPLHSPWTQTTAATLTVDIVPCNLTCLSVVLKAQAHPGSKTTFCFVVDGGTRSKFSPPPTPLAPIARQWTSLCVIARHSAPSATVRTARHPTVFWVPDPSHERACTVRNKQSCALTRNQP